MKKIFTFLLTAMLSMVGVSALAGNSTKYFRATAITTNSMEGQVYVAADNTTTPAYADTVDATATKSSQGAATQNFYYYAEAKSGYKFVGWAATQDAEEYLSDENPYMKGMSSSSESQTNPAKDTLYAFFDVATEFYSSLVSATTKGQGLVSVSDTANSTEFAEAMADTILNSPYTEHTYYLKAQVSDVELTHFVGWYTDEACTELLSAAANYTYKVTVSSTDETAPTAFNVYAKFNSRSPYQFKNASFEYWNSSVNEPAPGWSGPASADVSALGLLGETARSSAPAPERAEGREGGYSVRLISKSTMGVNANGNLTTGIMNMGSMTASASSNNNHTVLDDPNHHLIIAGQPDSLVYYSKYKKGESGDYMASAKVYIHDAVANYQDPIIESQNSHLMGYCYTPAPESEDWIRNAGAFEYDYEGWDFETVQATTKYVLCDLTTNPTAGGSAGDTLVIDDIAFIYNSELVSAKFGEDTVIFNENGQFTLDKDYDEAALELVSNGRGASIGTSFEPNGLLTITVKGQDIEYNAENQHVYQIQFKAVATAFDQATMEHSTVEAIYDIMGRRYSTMQPGINIVRMRDGSCVKVMR